MAAAVQVDGEVVRNVRLAFGAVAHKPWRAYTKGIGEIGIVGSPAAIVNAI